MSRRHPQTLIDYLIVAIAPALIMLLVGSFVFFVITVFYDGEFLGRLKWIAALFVMAAVLIARISIEEGRSYAALFAVALGGAMLLAMAQFVGGSLLFHLLILGLIWLMADRITWDCTVVDEHQDASAQGLLQTAGLDRDATALPQPTAPQPASAPQPNHRGQGFWGTLRRNWNQPHAPGTWVIYFLLASLPMWGLGQWIMNDDLLTRRSAFFHLMVYVASGLALLCTTSLLGLRRYLRQRGVPMPGPMALVWILLGGGMVVVVLLASLILPRPAPEYSLSHVRFGSRDDLTSSDVSFGDEGVNDPEGTDRVVSETGEQEAEQAGGTNSEQTSQGDGERSGGTQSSSSNSQGQNAGASQQQNSQQQESQQQNSPQQNSQQQESQQQNSPQQNSPQQNSPQQNSPQQNSQQQNSQQQNSQQQNSQQQNSPQQDTQPNPRDSQQQADAERQGSQAPDSRRRQQPDRQGSRGRQSRDPSARRNASEQGRERSGESGREPLFQNWFQNLGEGARWALMIAYWAAVIGIVGYFLVRYRREILAALRRFWQDLQAWWARLTGSSPAPAPTEQSRGEEVERPPAFATFSNPFASGAAAQLSTEQLVRLSFEAFEAWAYERGSPRGSEQTPLEFTLSIASSRPELAEPARVLGRLYSQLAYGTGRLPEVSRAHLQALWSHLDRREAVPA